MNWRLTVLTAICLLAFPAVASAGVTPIVPPGNAGVNQYVENVPTATGNRPVTSVTHPGNAPAGPSQPAAQPVSPSTQTALTSQGADGARVLALTRRTAPAPHSARQHGSAGAAATSGGGGGGGGGAPPPGSSVGSVVGSLTGSGGVGVGLLIALIAVALGMAGIVVARHRHAGE